MSPKKFEVGSIVNWLFVLSRLSSNGILSPELLPYLSIKFSFRSSVVIGSPVYTSKIGSENSIMISEESETSTDSSTKFM